MNHHYYERKYEAIIEDFLQLVGSSFSIALIIYASPQIILASIVVQALLNLCQARLKWHESKTPEAFVKFIIACFRLHEGKQRWDRLQKQNELDALFKTLAANTQNSPKNTDKPKPAKLSEKVDPPKIDPPIEINVKKQSQEEISSDPVLRQLAEKVATSKQVEHLRDSPLQGLEGKISERQVVMESAPGKFHNCGSHFHGYGKSLVKGANLRFQAKKIDGKEVTELQFKVNHERVSVLSKIILETNRARLMR